MRLFSITWILCQGELETDNVTVFGGVSAHADGHVFVVDKVVPSGHVGVGEFTQGVVGIGHAHVNHQLLVFLAAFGGDFAAAHFYNVVGDADHAGIGFQDAGQIEVGLRGAGVGVFITIVFQETVDQLGGVFAFIDGHLHGLDEPSLANGEPFNINGHGACLSFRGFGRAVSGSDRQSGSEHGQDQDQREDQGAAFDALSLYHLVLLLYWDDGFFKRKGICDCPLAGKREDRG